MMENLNKLPFQNPQLFEKAIQILQNPLCDPENPNYNIVTSILASNEFFQKNLKSSIKFHDFINAAKYYLNYEVHPYGSILIKDTEYTDKFFILLKGRVNRFHQRSFYEVEQDINQKNQPSPKNSQEQTPNTSNNNLPSDSLDPRKSSIYIRNNKKSFTLHHQNSLTNDSHRQRGTIGKSPARILVISSDTKTLTDYHPQNVQTATLPRHSKLDLLSPTNLGLGNKPSIRASLLTPTDKSAGSSARSRVSIAMIDEEKSPKPSDMISPLVTPSIFIDSPKQANNKISSDHDLNSFKDIKEGSLEEIISKDTPEKSTKESVPMTFSDFQLINEIAAKDALVKRRCFVDDVVRLGKTRVYYPGDYFGEKFCKQYQAKENAILAVASEEVHVLTMSRESYQNIMAELLKQAKEKFQIFAEIFPSLSQEAAKKFSSYFSQKHFKQGEVIYQQNDSAETLYLLHNGDIKLLKTTTGENLGIAAPKSSRKVDIPITNIIKNQFFGEEILLDQQTRQFSAVANAPTNSIYYLNHESYSAIIRKFPKFFKNLKEQANEKFTWREQRYVELAEKQQNFNITLPTMNSLNTSIISETPISQRTPQVKVLPRRHFPRQNSLFSSESEQNPSKNSSSAAIEDFQRLKIQIPQQTAASFYKVKFSRKIDIKEKFDTEAETTPVPKIITRAPRKNSEPITKDSLNHFNIRKELRTPKSPQVKLMRHASTGSIMALKTTDLESPREPMSSRTTQVTQNNYVMTLLTEKDDEKNNMNKKDMSEFLNLTKRFPKLVNSPSYIKSKEFEPLNFMKERAIDFSPNLTLAQLNSMLSPTTDRTPRRLIPSPKNMFKPKPIGGFDSVITRNFSSERLNAMPYSSR